MTGPGLLGGRVVDHLVGIRPDDIAYVTHAGAVFHAQGADNGNMAFYEIGAAGDTIDFDLGEVAGDMDEPRIVITTAWGSTDFDLIDRDDSETVIDESSGFDTDVWLPSIQVTSPNLRLTDFQDTQAAFLPYIGVYDALV